MRDNGLKNMRDKIMILLSDIEFYQRHNADANFILGYTEQQLKYIIMEIESDKLVKERNRRYGG